MTIRSMLRDAAGEAIEFSDWAAVAEPQAFVRVRSWGQALSVDHYPVFGLSTARQRTEYFDKTTYLRTIDLSIAWKRQGANDGIEDLIDADGSEIEALVLAALAPLTFDVVPLELTISTDAADGGARVGVGTYAFACQVLTPINAD